MLPLQPRPSIAGSSAVASYLIFTMLLMDDLKVTEAPKPGNPYRVGAPNMGKNILRDTLNGARA